MMPRYEVDLDGGDMEWLKAMIEAEAPARKPGVTMATGDGVGGGRSVAQAEWEAQQAATASRPIGSGGVGQKPPTDAEVEIVWRRLQAARKALEPKYEWNNGLVGFADTSGAQALRDALGEDRLRDELARAEREWAEIVRRAKEAGR